MRFRHDPGGQPFRNEPAVAFFGFRCAELAEIEIASIEANASLSSRFVMRERRYFDLEHEQPSEAMWGSTTPMPFGFGPL